jgi:hypothetical protein
MAGAAVVFLEGPRLGANDSDPFEAALGCADGVTMGTSEGTMVLLSDGSIEGYNTGSELGLTDGVIFGMKDGPMLGLPDGIPDGASDGDMMGLAEGTMPTTSRSLLGTRLGDSLGTVARD